jgi:hypothetical protein
MSLVSHLNRKSKVRNTDAVDCDFPVVRKALSIDEAGRLLQVHRFGISKLRLPSRRSSAKKIAVGIDHGL